MGCSYDGYASRQMKVKTRRREVGNWSFLNFNRCDLFGIETIEKTWPKKRNAPPSVINGLFK